MYKCTIYQKILSTNIRIKYLKVLISNRTMSRSTVISICLVFQEGIYEKELMHNMCDNCELYKRLNNY